MSNENIFLLNENEDISDWIAGLIHKIEIEKEKEENLPAISGIRISTEKEVEELPEGYDFYFVHTSNFRNFESLKELKQKQPWSYFFGYTNDVAVYSDRDGCYHNKKEVGFDSLCTIIDLDKQEIKRFLKKGCNH